MKRYRVELRASPDTPPEEAWAKRTGRVLGPQTVFYTVCAESPVEAGEKAPTSERAFIYRKVVWLFCDPVELND